MVGIDVTCDEAMSLSEARELLPRGRNNSKPHLSTLIRWITLGTVAPDGRQVFLGGVRLGGRWVTTRDALKAFSAELTAHGKEVATNPRGKKAKSPRRREVPHE